MRGTTSRLSSWISSTCALIGALGIVAMLLQITADVVLRQLLDMPIPATVEIVSRYYMVMIAFLPLGWSELRREMIKVDILAPAFQGAARGINMLFVDLLTILAYAILAATTWVAALGEYQSGSFVLVLSSKLPVWPSFFVLPFGFSIAAVSVALRLWQDIHGGESGAAREAAP